jgi:GDP/UDP-N,N'-diacetylbacillosamine 2-epimerase (hydrolysing)
MKRKICVVTGGRADYGLLRWVIQGINDDPNLILQLIATGSHLSPIHGDTYLEIKKDGFTIDFTIDILTEDDSPTGISKSIASAVVGCSEKLKILNPDVVVLLGDRFEIFAAATAALVSRIPVAHLHGGETTLGAIDEALRHSITKMSHLHFVATETYKNRVIQLGESPSQVFNVGGLGIDGINKLRLLSRQEIESSLGVRFNKKNVLVTFHPVTLEDDTAATQMIELLSALSELSDTTVVFTLPNSDTGGLKVIKIIEEHVSQNENSYAFSSLGQLLYLSTMAQVDLVIGNSSSGIMEAPTFKKGTLNIGDRQAGRLQAKSIINCRPEKESILEGINKLYSKDFQSKLSDTKNPYGDGFASEKVVSILSTISLEGLLKKAFYDL